jgi:hypothetical protein
VQEYAEVACCFASVEVGGYVFQMSQKRWKWLVVAGVLWVGTQACNDEASESGQESPGVGGGPSGSGGEHEPTGSGGLIPSGGHASGGTALGGTGFGGASEGGMGGELPVDARCSQDPFVNTNGAGGTCGAHFVRYSFNSETGACEQFAYTGCHGSDNNFGTLALCEAACVRN